MNEEIKEKKLTKEQKKDLKLKEKFREIDKKFKRVDKLYKLSTEFEDFRNKDFETLKENLCSQIDKHVEATISQYSHEIMTDIRDHQLGTLPIVSSKEAIRMLKKEVDELGSLITMQSKDNYATYEKVNLLIDSFKDLQEIQSGETDRIFSNINLLESDIIKKDKYQNERLNKQAETHRLEIEQVKNEIKENNKSIGELIGEIKDIKYVVNMSSEELLYCSKRANCANDRVNDVELQIGSVENKISTNETYLKYLIFFIALNFGLTIFLLINFFMVFDFLG